VVITSASAKSEFGIHTKFRKSPTEFRAHRNQRAQISEFYLDATFQRELGPEFGGRALSEKRIAEWGTDAKFSKHHFLKVARARNSERRILKLARDAKFKNLARLRIVQSNGIFFARNALVGLNLIRDAMKIFFFCHSLL